MSILFSDPVHVCARLRFYTIKHAANDHLPRSDRAGSLAVIFNFLFIDRCLHSSSSPLSLSLSLTLRVKLIWTISCRRNLFCNCPRPENFGKTAVINVAQFFAVWINKRKERRRVAKRRKWNVESTTYMQALWERSEKKKGQGAVVWSKHTKLQESRYYHNNGWSHHPFRVYSPIAGAARFSRILSLLESASGSEV